jgi:hypothetical protein
MPARATLYWSAPSGQRVKYLLIRHPIHIIISGVFAAKEWRNAPVNFAMYIRLIVQK